MHNNKIKYIFRMVNENNTSSENLSESVTLDFWKSCTLRKKSHLGVLTWTEP